jgi:NTP pyrophosphatase (non-canonical NTP hydrolase)
MTALETFDSYQREVARTAPAGPTTPLVLATLALGLTGEAGEVADLVKKYIGHGHDLPSSKVREELGDALWYITDLAAKLGFSLEEVAAFNVAKLRRRYPGGFSHEASRARIDVTNGETP